MIFSTYSIIAANAGIIFQGRAVYKFHGCFHLHNYRIPLKTEISITASLMFPALKSFDLFSNKNADVMRYNYA